MSIFSRIRDGDGSAHRAFLWVTNRSGVLVLMLAAACLTLFPGRLSGAAPNMTPPRSAVSSASFVQEATSVRQVPPGSGEDPLVLAPGLSWNGERWEWRARPKEWLVGMAIGFAVALWLLLTATATRTPPLLARPTSPGGALARTAFGPGGFSRMLILGRDPLVWVYLVAAAAFAGFIYMGAFDLITRELDQLTDPKRWAPAGGLGVLGLLFGGGARWRFSRREFKGHDAEALAKTVEERSNPLLDLVRARVDRDVRRRILDIAAGYEVGLIQRTMWNVSHDAIDRGRLSPEQLEGIMDALLDVRSGSEERDTFLNRMAAVEHATRLVDLDDLEEILRQGDRRARRDRRLSAADPVSEERRAGQDRRVRSQWRPIGQLEQQEAA